MFLLTRCNINRSLQRLWQGNRRICSVPEDISRIHHGKVALITGSNDTGGVGFAIARSLAKRGCNIILSGTRDKEHVEPLRTELEAQYEIPAHYLQVDFTDLDAIPKLYDDVKHIYSNGIDILINNAGLLSLYSIEDFPMQVWLKDIRVNLTAPFYLTKLLLPDMRQKGWGRILMMSSNMGSNGYPKYSSYCSTKHGINGLTKVVALETLSSGVTCNAIAPAAADSATIKSLIKGKAAEWDVSLEDAKTKILETFNPSGQLVELEQIGELSAFLCSPAADQITGSIYSIDAGFSAR